MRSIAIVSGKGGVGLTTISINLATAITSYGRACILVDADLDAPNAALVLGKTSFEETTESIIKGTHSIKQAVFKHQSGLMLIPGSVSIEHLGKKEQDKLLKACTELESVAELLIFDTNTGFGEDVLAILPKVTDIILVTTPDFVSLTESLKMIKIIKQKKGHLLGVVVNKYSNKEHDLKIENIQSVLNEPVIGIIPEDYAIKESLHLKFPVVYSHPRSKASMSFHKLACNLIEVTYEPPQEESTKKQKVMETVMEKIGLKKWYNTVTKEDLEE